MTDTLIPTGWEPTPNRKRFTRDECAFLVDSQLLTGRYELIDGEIIFKMGQKRPHSLTLVLLNAWLIGLFGALAVQCQLPIDVAAEDNTINEPEPDLTVLAQPATAYAFANPGPADILLLVEVSDSTRTFDLTTKAKLYARAGIVEYWVADIQKRRFVVHCHPAPTGYAEVTAFNEEADIATLIRPDAPIRVSELLPPLQP